MYLGFYLALIRIHVDVQCRHSILVPIIHPLKIFVVNLKFWASQTHRSSPLLWSVNNFFPHRRFLSFFLFHLIWNRLNRLHFLLSFFCFRTSRNPQIFCCCVSWYLLRRMKEKKTTLSPGFLLFRVTFVFLFPADTFLILIRDIAIL